MKKVSFLLCVLCTFTLMVGPAGGAKKKAPVSDGPYRMYYNSGSLMRVDNYKFEQLNGTSTEYYENGSLKAVTQYVKDLREGEAKTYFE